MHRPTVVFSALAASLTVGCATRTPAAAPSTVVAHVASNDVGPDRAAEIEAGLERSKEGKPFLTMLGDEETKKAMPSIFKRGGAPYLIRVGGLQPKTMESLMAMAKQMRTEGGLGDDFLNDVFWVVSSENECFY
jgi:hypothetical protein